MPRWLDHHKLLYFRAVARTGSLAAASGELRLAPQTLSEHIQQLEASLGEPLLVRGSRGMTLTDAGRVALAFADEIHALGQELVQTFEGGRHAPARMVVGVDESLPRLVVWQQLAPAVGALGGAALVCRDGAHHGLLEQLRARVLDAVLSSSDELPEGCESLRRVMLAEAPVSWVAPDALAATLREDFPRSLEGAPVVMPAAATPLRRALDAWCARVGVRPAVVAEVADPALAKTACAEGLGAMALSEVALPMAAARYGLRAVGACEGVVERVFAFAAPRRQGHPAVEALLAARATRP